MFMEKVLVVLRAIVPDVDKVWFFVGVEPKPIHAVDYGLDVLGYRAVGVSILNSQYELSATVASVEPAE